MVRQSTGSGLDVHRFLGLPEGADVGFPTTTLRQPTTSEPAAEPVGRTRRDRYLPWRAGRARSETQATFRGLAME